MRRQARKRTRQADGSADATGYAPMVVALLACLVRGIEDSADQIHIMDAFGVSSTMIAKVMGISPISVRTSLHRKRRAKKR